MKTSLRIASRLGLLALILAGPMASARSASDWKPRAGDRLLFELTLANYVKYDVNGKVFETGGSSTLDLTWAVKDVAPNGDAQVTLTIDRLRTSSQGSSSKSEFDSNQKPGATSSPLAPFYAGAIGESYTARITPAGEVLDLKVPAKLTESLSGTPFLGPKNASSLLSIESTLVSPEAIQALIRWLIPRESTAGRPVELPIGQFRFAITNRRVSPAGSARVENETVAVVKSAPGIPLKVEVDRQKGRGLQTFDASSGLLTDSTSEQSVDLTIGNAGRTLRQTIELTASLKCLGATPGKP